jgi:hypothetical protein
MKAPYIPPEEKLVSEEEMTKNEAENRIVIDEIQNE